jgi:signal transduction histidine kinase
MYLVRLIILFLLYVLTAKLGLSFYAVDTFATLVWLPTAIALSALVLYDYDLWPAIFAGAFLTNVTTGAPVLSALGIAFGNTAEALLGAYLLKDYFKIDPLFRHVRDSVSTIAVAITVTALCATVGVFSLVAGGAVPIADTAPAWLAWWLGDSLSALVFMPFLVRWGASPSFSRTRRQWGEIILVFGLLVSTSFAVFWTGYAEIGIFPLVYLLFLPLIWIALRIGPRGMTLGTVLISLIAMGGILRHQGPFFGVSPQADLLSLQLFIAFIVLIFLPFCSIVEEQKETSRTLFESVERLKQALARISSEDQAKNNFLAVLAHELRNPLAPIVSSLELIKIETNDKNENIQKLLGIIDTHMYTITVLLDDLLDVSRISRNKLKLQKESVELQSAVRHSLGTVDTIYKSRNQALSVSLPERSIWLSADPVRLEQILVNLLSNAARYTDPGGKISIEASVEGAIVRLTVKDNGSGIRTDMLKKIFEPFTQSPTNPRRTGGLGIGLSVTKRLVELHGGKIWAQSEGVGKGSAFIVTLPLGLSPQLPLRFSGTATKLKEAFFGRKIEAQKRAVLVVDDNEAAAHGLRTLLAHGGHDVRVAHDGQSALAVAQEFRPSVVLLDIGLPDMSGHQVATKMREEFGQSAMLVALTGYGQDEDKAKAHAAGFDYHLTKPVGIADVERIIAKKTN